MKLAGTSSTSKHVRLGSHGRAWKSMEELPMKGPASREGNEWQPSSQWLPSHAAVHIRGSSISPRARRMEAKTVHMFSEKGLELQEAFTQFLTGSERELCKEQSSLSIHEESHEIPHLSNPSYDAGIGGESQLASMSCGMNYLPQQDTEGSTNTAESSNRTIMQTNCEEQTLPLEQEMSTVCSRSVACAEGEGAELQQISTCVPHGLDDYAEHDNTLPVEVWAQADATAKEMADMELASEDNELVSQVNNIDCQDSQSCVSTPPRRTYDTKHTVQVEDISNQSARMEVSLLEHLRQDHTDRGEPSMPNFIMHRFLPAAQEIAAMEQESFIALIASRNRAAAVCPLPSRSQRPSVAHRIKKRAYSSSKGFTTTGLMHAKQQEDAMSLKSCGFFCLGLKSALFRAHRSALSATRKTSWTSHVAGHAKVSDKGSSPRGSKNKGQPEAMEAGSYFYSPSRTSSKFHETPRRHAMKCQETSIREGHSSVKSKPLYSQLGKLDAAGNLDEHTELSGNAELRLVGMVSKRQESNTKEDSAESFPGCIASNRQEGTLKEGMGTHSLTSSVSHDHARNLYVHDHVNADITGSPKQVHRDAMKAISCPEQDQASQDGDVEQDQAWQESHSNKDGESPFFDALSRLNSVKSTASFYTFGSPASQYDNVGLQNEWGMKDESGSIDAASEFETPRASISENNSMLTPSQVENKAPMNSEPSSLSQRFGKVLKLETHEHMSVPGWRSGPSGKHPCFEDISMLQASDWRVESFSRMNHVSLDRKYPLSPKTVSPIFPAKCQSGSALGWPLGISSYQSNRLESSPDLIDQDNKMQQYVPGLHIPSPPLPPSPKGSWLGKAMAKNASNTSPLATVQQKYKVASARRKLDFLVANENSEKRWEDVVKGSQVQTGHLRFSEELHQHHPLNHSEIQPLKL
ncbi:hypothetical protein GOP47_0013770 [Adiantum capillus-veneris]|uniref:Uncharacterized protein n=1 Tax=Adiantum capillus-veneris TaxID=13818 RepID=A0A9D4UPN7_ADICA|nr:hypothetical protein GOP47_0013770 [Adiantum capillus-veneris]